MILTDVTKLTELTLITVITKLIEFTKFTKLTIFLELTELAEFAVLAELTELTKIAKKIISVSLSMEQKKFGGQVTLAASIMCHVLFQTEYNAHFKLVLIHDSL